MFKHSQSIAKTLITARIATVIEHVVILSEVTKETVRLYCTEGQHLSMRGGEMKRLTWYTSPRSAIEIGENMGRLTGRLVYFDLELDWTSPVRRRFYKAGDEAYILQGELIPLSKRKCKYYSKDVTV
jgi:hypothetical protein